LQIDEAFTLTALKPCFSKMKVERCALVICRRQGGFGSFGVSVAARPLVGVRNEKIVSRRITLRVVMSENDEESRRGLKVIHNERRMSQLVMCKQGRGSSGISDSEICESAEASETSGG
jgi:hypothetical protein